MWEADCIQNILKGLASEDIKEAVEKKFKNWKQGYDSKLEARTPPALVLQMKPVDTGNEVSYQVSGYSFWGPDQVMVSSVELNPEKNLIESAPAFRTFLKDIRKEAIGEEFKLKDSVLVMMLQEKLSSNPTISSRLLSWVEEKVGPKLVPTTIKNVTSLSL